MGKAGGSIRVLALCAILAATMGLAACGGNAAQESSTSEPATSAASSTASVAGDTGGQASSVDEYDLTSAWCGMIDDDTMAYYYESADQNAGAILIYHVADSAYERWVGPMEAADDGTRTITDAETGAAISFTITPADDDAIEIAADNGLAGGMSAMSIEEVGATLDEVSAYAKRV